MLLRHGNIGEAAIVGSAGAYGNVGYMGPGLALATLGPASAPAVAIIFCIDSVVAFTLVPLLMGMAGTSHRTPWQTVIQIVRQIAFHPFLIAVALGILSAALHIRVPTALDRMMELLQAAAAPCALFTLGVTVALRPVEKMPWGGAARNRCKTDPASHHGLLRAGIDRQSQRQFQQRSGSAPLC